MMITPFLYLYIHSLILSLLLVICYSSSVHQPLRHNDERLSLLQFKESFVFDDIACDSFTYSKLDSWKLGTDYCLWDGVACDKAMSHVIGLDLTSSCLFGSINSTSPLFRLVHLTNLNLAYNNFNLSTIPSAIRRLSRLTHLNLSFSNFYDQIPFEIFELSHLVSLDLSNNTLMLQNPSLQDLIDSFTNLATLHLSGIMISSHVPWSLTNLTRLSSLLLRDCGLQGEFPSKIFQLPNLRFLSLRFNPDLSGNLPEFEEGNQLELLRLEGTKFTGHLPKSIGNLKSLSNFGVSGCGFSGQLPSSIGNLSSLKFLDLSDNNFVGMIPSSLGNLVQLNYLSLSSNNLCGRIPPSIANVMGLISLSLSFNNFCPGTLSWVGNLTSLNFLDLAETNTYGEIPSSLQNLTQLINLILYSNRLSGIIPSWIGNCTYLNVLQLANNTLHGPIPESILSHTKLEVLELHYNHLNGTLNSDLFLKSPSLIHLQLSYNDLSLISNPNLNATYLPKFISLGLSSCNLSKFPSFLRGQNELEFLDLSFNKITGHVPNWISSIGPERLGILNLDSNVLTGFEQPLNVVLPWTNLHVLNLTANKLEGPLPIPPPSIFIYIASNNKFSGQIPAAFCNLTSILTLDLSKNNLSGTLPLCLGRLTNFVSALDLRHNNLSGSIPDRFTMGCTLRMIDLSQNKLEGKIPSSLANCTKLESLNLGENHITDIFPYWLGVLPELRVLILRSNSLVGAMQKPETKFQFPKLHIIDLSTNNLTGKLPLEYFKHWIAMKIANNSDTLKYMEANTSFQIPGYSWSNQFSYSITISNKGLELTYERVQELLTAIDLSENRFEGEIPEVIGSLTQLELLNLSNNILTGRIPLCLGNLNQLEALDLSINKLSGEIPMQLRQLKFLAFINVSQNCLTGPIPRGQQFNTFENKSFLGNPGLCGTPLSKKCGDDGVSRSPHQSYQQSRSPYEFEFSWNMVLMGFASGSVIGIVIGCTMNTCMHQWLIKLFAPFFSKCLKR